MFLKTHPWRLSFPRPEKERKQHEQTDDRGRDRDDVQEGHHGYA
jgi:hypothetical protein